MDTPQNITKNTPSLGDLLRNRVLAEKENERVKLERKAREAGEAAMKDLRIIDEFFENAKSHFTKNIIDGVAIKPINVGQDNREVSMVLSTFSTTQVNQKGHKYAACWTAFALWASENGLRPLWIYQHDGVGMESWHVLSVEPE